MCELLGEFMVPGVVPLSLHGNGPHLMVNNEGWGRPHVDLGLQTGDIYSMAMTIMTLTPTRHSPKGINLCGINMGINKSEARLGPPAFFEPHYHQHFHSYLTK
jgi:hypothetical protein